MKVPDEWHPTHPDYPLHLARVQLRTALALAEGLRAGVRIFGPHN